MFSECRNTVKPPGTYSLSVSSKFNVTSPKEDHTLHYPPDQKCVWGFSVPSGYVSIVQCCTSFKGY